MRSHFGKHHGWQLLLGLLIGCGASRPPQVVSVATLDLGCDKVDVSEVAQDRYAAYGCGRGAVYARVCDGQSCRWGRLRHGHEESVAAGGQQLAPPAPREVLPAPLPEQREVLPAPSPQREVLPAPAPEGAAPSASDSASSAAQAGTGQPLENSALQAGAADVPVPLSQGSLSDPYQAQVPAQPLAQQVMYPPPAPLVETPPPPPQRSYVWIGGWWWWGPANWVWVPGYWGAPYYGYSYIGGSWYWGSGCWNYRPGGWARPGTTVIVHHGYPARPSTTVSVRAFTPHRAVHAGYVGGSSGHRVVSAAPGGYRPHGSPLYPSAAGRTVVRAAPGSYGYGGGSSSYRGAGSYHGGSPGRVVSPNSNVRAPQSFGDSYRAPSRAYGSSGSVYRATPNSGGGGRSYGGSSGSSYSGGGGRSYSGGGGGGGRSYSGGGGGGGGGHSYGGRGGGGGSVHVSPGGGHRR
jgi:hypothetical protein